MEYLFFYGLQMANYITVLAVTLLFIAPLVIGFVTTMFLSYSYEELQNHWNKWMKKTLVTSLVTSLVLFALPTKQTLLLMGGTYLGKRAVNEVVNSDKLEKINKIIDLQLDKYIKELKSNNNAIEEVE